MEQVQFESCTYDWDMVTLYGQYHLPCHRCKHFSKTYTRHMYNICMVIYRTTNDYSTNARIFEERLLLEKIMYYVCLLYTTIKYLEKIKETICPKID